MASKELIESLETVWELANQNALDTESDDFGDEGLNDEAVLQRHKLSRVRKFIDNIKDESNEMNRVFEAINRSK